MSGRDMSCPYQGDTEWLLAHISTSNQHAEARPGSKASTGSHLENNGDPLNLGNLGLQRHHHHQGCDEGDATPDQLDGPWVRQLVQHEDLCLVSAFCVVLPCLRRYQVRKHTELLIRT